ncbi:hypothetical protein DS891_08155 [Pseudoalteromonas sp. JC28]|uniref:hypothetical protein n=1 Tax=Pseudoalteromonas sp. JC28 TaxID=2267617 RepID=UPI001574B471|nr:hypothetical protein [Pseudoalteromonas sp. JC28]NSY33563.1 hypothetical protein [Pseudoalteromonas sp. JC28]
MLKTIFICFSLVLSIPINAACEIALIDTKFSGKHYKESQIDKSLIFELELSAEQVIKVNDISGPKIALFEYQVSDTSFKNEVLFCENKTLSIKTKWEQLPSNIRPEFLDYWKQQLRACHGKYVQSSPDVSFMFSNLDTKKYSLNELEVVLLAYENSQATHQKYFSNETEAKELLLLDKEKLDENKKLTTKLKQTHIVDKTHFTLSLKLLDKPFWEGKFIRNRHVLYVRFHFVRPDQSIYTVESPIFVTDI